MLFHLFRIRTKLFFLYNFSQAWSVPQNAILGLITRWINYDVNLRERHMKTLLMFVNWNTLDGAAISEHIDREPLYSNSEISLYLILQALVENNLLFPKYQSIYQALQDKFSQVSLNSIAFSYAMGIYIDDHEVSVVQRYSTNQTCIIYYPLYFYG